MTLWKDEIFVLIGTNGSGKSTFLNALNGLISYTGNIFYKSFKKIDKIRISTCFQNNVFIADFTVLENLTIFN